MFDEVILVLGTVVASIIGIAMVIGFILFLIGLLAYVIGPIAYLSTVLFGILFLAGVLGADANLILIGMIGAIISAIIWWYWGKIDFDN